MNTYTLNRNILELLLKFRLSILICLILSLFIGISYAFSIPKTYLSSSMLKEAETKERNNVGASSGLSSLASLAGINLSSSFKNDGRLIEVRETIKSRKFITDLIKKHNLQKDIMAAKGWNKSTGLKYKSQLIKDNKFLDISNENLWRQFTSNLLVDIDEESEFLRIGYIHYSPVFAQKTVELITKEINEYIRQRDLKNAQSSLKYLEANVSGINNSELKQVFYFLIKDETRVLMLANSVEEYVVQVIDPAFLPELKFAPRRSIVTLTISIFITSLYLMFLIIAEQQGYTVSFRKEYKFIKLTKEDRSYES